MKVKVCGIKDRNFLGSSGRLGPDFIGFIFFPGSPRFLSNELSREEMDMIPAKIKRVGVFVDEEADSVLEKVRRYSLDYVQLHGNEDPEYLQSLKGKTKVIKAFRVDGHFDFGSVSAFEESSELFLFDTRTRTFGGSGKQFDWKLLDAYRGNTPFLLSGGIGPEDAETVLKIRHEMFAGVDINSRFELEPGIKDVELVAKFLKQIR